MAQSLTLTVSYLTELRARLAKHEQEAASKTAELKRLIAENQTVLNNAEAGLDNDKIELAKTIIKVRGLYAKGGEDRASVIQDAVQWLATGKCAAYRGLDAADFGTKSYDCWYGQRSDHEWGGPRHGSIIFQVGLIDRKRVLTADEREAAIYYLLNLQRAQEAAEAARLAA